MIMGKRERKIQCMIEVAERVKGDKDQIVIGFAQNIAIRPHKVKSLLLRHCHMYHISAGWFLFC